MIRYQYTTKNKKFISRIYYDIGQFNSKFRVNELQERLQDNLNSKDEILGWVLRNKLLKKIDNNEINKILPRINIIPFLVDLVHSLKIDNIISMGSGLGVIEYLLKNSLPDKNVYACDFNPLCIDVISKYFPELKAIEFNFFEDNLEKKIEHSIISNSMVIFISSSYVMSDKEYVRVFNSLKKSGVKYIVDFSSGFLTRKQTLKEIIKIIFDFLNIQLFATPSFEEINSFQGYSRSLNHFRKIINESGYKIIKESNFSTYDYVVFLEA